MIIKETKKLSLNTPEKIGFRYIGRVFISYILSVFYKLYMNMIYPKTIEKTYKVAICAIFRDEGKYLKEWINYHLLVGIEHFYLYNNFSVDNYQSILQPFINYGKVTLIDWPVKLGQLSAYTDCIERFGHQSKWIGFIDLDEFIVPNKDINVYNFLEPFEKNRPSVLLYWKYFGSSGKMQRDEDDLVTEDFTICWEKCENLGKCFFNTKYDFSPQYRNNQYFHHVLWGKYKCINLPPVNIVDKPVIFNIHRIKTKQFPIQINHYVNKSYKEYWDRKANRGGGTHDERMHDKEYFTYHESRCVSTDYHIYKYLIQLKEQMQV